MLSNGKKTKKKTNILAIFHQYSIDMIVCLSIGMVYLAKNLREKFYIFFLLIPSYGEKEEMHIKQNITIVFSFDIIYKVVLTITYNNFEL